MVTGDGWGIYYQRGSSVLKAWSDKLHIVLIVQTGSLGLQAVGKFGRHAVVAADAKSLGQEIARQGTHAYTAGTDEID
jgi:hypothetical protein